MARPTKTYQQTLLERAQDLQALLEHFCVTRPLQCEEYQSAGQFNIKSFFNQHHLVMGWKSASRQFKGSFWREYRTCRDRHNEVFGIPQEVIHEVLGWYRGKRIPLDAVLQKSQWKIVNWGTRVHYYKKTQTRKVKCSWKRKIFPTSDKAWRAMLMNPAYDSIDTAPHMTKRVKRIIENWEKED